MRRIHRGPLPFFEGLRVYPGAAPKLYQTPQFEIVSTSKTEF